MDVSSISAAYTSIKIIRDLSKALLDGKIDAEAKQRVYEVIDKLGSVQDALFFVREELIKVQDENIIQRSRIKELEERLELKGRVIFERPSYWVRTDNEPDGPFCQRCFDVETKLIRLQLLGNDTWKCHSCTNVVRGPEYKSPEQKPRRSSLIP